MGSLERGLGLYLHPFGVGHLVYSFEASRITAVSEVLADVSPITCMVHRTSSGIAPVFGYPHGSSSSALGMIFRIGPALGLLPYSWPSRGWPIDDSVPPLVPVDTAAGPSVDTLSSIRFLAAARNMPPCAPLRPRHADMDIAPLRPRHADMDIVRAMIQNNVAPVPIASRGLSPTALLHYADDVEQRCLQAFTLLFGALASPLLMPPDLAAEDASADASAPVPSLPAAVGVASADAGAAPPRSDAAPWHPSDPPFARKAF